jgi:5-methylcytosine-specific restriction enzyme A
VAVRPRALGQKPKAQRRRDNDAVRRQAKPWRSWYSLPVWQAIRAEQLARQPLCERHLKRGEIVAATVVNHVGRHGGDWDRFVTGPFESLCKPCHDSDVQREERAEAVRSSSTLRP